ncbi:hypothetical protein MYX04_01855 [Nitrospiraceae bacterium AH_259_D15_M11_P09]|nr:hypothetical protein [Nitrospiraceae bacterium AH_259_D15_M11_P09]
MLEVIEKQAFLTRRRKPNCSRIVSNTQPLWRFCNALEFGLQPGISLLMALSLTHEGYQGFQGDGDEEVADWQRRS